MRKAGIEDDDASTAGLSLAPRTRTRYAAWSVAYRGPSLGPPDQKRRSTSHTVIALLSARVTAVYSCLCAKHSVCLSRRIDGSRDRADKK